MAYLPSYLIPLSAETENNLSVVKKKCSELLQSRKLSIRTFTIWAAQINASTHPKRIAVTGGSGTEILEKLKNAASSISSHNEPPKFVFLFPGQGSQFHRMGKILFDLVPVYREAIEKCETYLMDNLGLSIIKPLWVEPEKKECVQLGLFVIEYGILILLRHLGITPSIVLGHSLGEYVASVAAGLLTVEDVLNILGKRVQLERKYGPGRMLALACGNQKLRSLLDDFHTAFPDYEVEMAAVNSPNQTAVSGSKEAIEEFQAFLEEEKVICIEVQSDYAFHSYVFDPMKEEFLGITKEATYNDPTAECVMLSSVTGNFVTEKLPEDYWFRNIRRVVQYASACSRLSKIMDKNTIFLEIGPGNAMGGYLRQNFPNQMKELRGRVLTTLGISEDKQWTTFLETMGQLFVAGTDVNFSPLFEKLKANKDELNTIEQAMQ